MPKWLWIILCAKEDSFILGLPSTTPALEYSTTLAQAYSPPALKGFGILASLLDASLPISTCILLRADLNQVWIPAIYCHHHAVESWPSLRS